MCDFNLYTTGACYSLAFYNGFKRIHGMSHVFPCVVFISAVYRTLDITVNL